MQQDEPRHRWHRIHYDLVTLGIDAVEQPVALHPELAERLRPLGPGAERARTFIYYKSVTTEIRSRARSTRIRYRRADDETAAVPG